MSQSSQSQVIGFIYESVFERFPNLKMVLIEGGFAWLPKIAMPEGFEQKLMYETALGFYRLPDALR